MRPRWSSSSWLEKINNRVVGEHKVRLKAIVAYDGANYGGFQRQANAPTIQAELEAVLEHLTQTPVRILAAGRTDAGVHAEGQVIAFDVDWQSPIADLQRGMNALLPKQIAVLQLGMVGDGFHPRYDASSRRYRYTLYRAPVRHPLVQRYSLHVAQSLDIEAMCTATQALIGQHDFRAFGSPPQGNHSVREIIGAAWLEDGPWLYFDIEGNAFLYRMVRMLVGTLLRVGYGALSVEDFVEILHTQNRAKAGPAVAAHGLCLKAVVYP